MVAMLKGHIAAKHGQSEDLAVFADDFAGQDTRPPRISGFLPDVYAKRVLRNVEIIGEAKTSNDVTSVRSVRQISAFYEYLSVIQCSYFYLAVPWFAKPKAVRLIEEMRRLHSGVKSRIVEYRGVI